MLEELLKQERKRKRKRHTNPLSQINKEIRLEAYTEQSESNPGRSLGIINKEGTAVWKTVPTRAGFTCSSLRDDHKCSKSITDNALMSLATKIMFWCKKWLEYLDKPMSISIFAPTNIFTARRQQILDTLWKWEKHGKTDSQHS